MAVKPVPDGCNSVNAYLVVPNAERALEFYRNAFGAETIMNMKAPSGGTVHAEMRIGNSTVMLSDENPQWGMKSAKTLGGSPVSLHLYVDDADKLFERATKAGCEVQQPMSDAFWGDRYGKVADPFGITWGIATHKEDVAPDEIDRRARKFFAEMAKQQ